MQVRRSLISTGLTVAVSAAVTATLTTTIGAAATPATPATPAAPAAAAVAVSNHPDPTKATLRQLAQHTKLRIGTAVNTDALANDATYAGWSPSSSRR